MCLICMFKILSTNFIVSIRETEQVALSTAMQTGISHNCFLFDS